MDPAREPDPTTSSTDSPVSARTQAGGSDPDDFGDLRQRLDALRVRLRNEGAASADAPPTATTKAPAITVSGTSIHDVRTTADVTLSPASGERCHDAPPGRTHADTAGPREGEIGERGPVDVNATTSDEDEGDPRSTRAWPSPRNGRTLRQNASLVAWTAVLVAALTTGAILGYQQLRSGNEVLTAPTTATTGPSESPTRATAAPVTVAPSSAAPDTASDSPLGGSGEAPPSPSPAPAEEPIEPAAVLDSASKALRLGGYPEVEVSLADGVLTLDGVVSADAVRTGYFAHVASVTALVSGIDGVDEVVPHLSLRGDETRLREELADIGASGALDFDTASAALSADALGALEEAAAVIQANPGLRVLVAGHTDAVGSADVNAELAAARAGAVVAELIRLGVPVTRLQVVAYGELFPNADATDAENRRVEFEVAP